MSTSQPRTLDAVMYPEAMQEEIVVTGSFENVSTGSQGSSTMEQSTLEKLPVQRTQDQAVLLSARTANTGPNNAISISGAQSWESLYTINGVVVNENIRGQALDLYIEDAVLEATTMTSNMSAEYGRFAGGIVNTVTKSGGNKFSGSFHINGENDSWNGETPQTTIRRIRTTTSTRRPSVDISCATRCGSLPPATAFCVRLPTDRHTRPAGCGHPLPNDPGRDPSRGRAHRLDWPQPPDHAELFQDIDFAYADFPNWPPAVDEAGLTSGSDPQTGVAVTYTGVLSDRLLPRGSLFQAGLHLYRWRRSQYRARWISDLGSAGERSPTTTPGLTPRARINNATTRTTTPRRRGSSPAAAPTISSSVVASSTTRTPRTTGRWPPAMPGRPSSTRLQHPRQPFTVIESYGGYIIWGDVLEESAIRTVVWRLQQLRIAPRKPCTASTSLPSTLSPGIP